MTYDAEAIRPSGIRRKLTKSSAIAISTGGDYIAAFFPRGATIRGIWFIPTVALTVANAVIDVGIAKDGDTVIDGVTISYTTSAIGTPVDIFQVKGTNGGVTVVGLNGVVWIQSDGGCTTGTGYFVIEYEDKNN